MLWPFIQWLFKVMTKGLKNSTQNSGHCSTPLVTWTQFEHLATTSHLWPVAMSRHHVIAIVYVPWEVFPPPGFTTLACTCPPSSFTYTHSVPFWPPCIYMHSPHALFFWSHCTRIYTFCALFPCTCKNTYISCLFLGIPEVSHAHTPCPLSLSLCTHILTLCPFHQICIAHAPWYSFQPS